MYCSAHFFVKKHVLSKLGDTIICAYRSLADIISTFNLQNFFKKILTFGSRGLSNLSVLECKRDVFDFLSHIDSRESEPYFAIYRVFNGTGKNFAVWHIFVSAA